MNISQKVEGIVKKEYLKDISKKIKKIYCSMMAIAQIPGIRCLLKC